MSLLSAVEPLEETPVDRYLAAQADLTAVDRFARRHEADLLPRQARYYRDLIPATRPGPGEQYGFEVDLDACTGCKACVAACHSLNGLDEGESWRTVSLLRGGAPTAPFQQTVTAACHHCLDPACLNGCPVDAYEKDAVTGVVAHLDDQCIGCGYCTLTCPYEVPSLNRDRGIVRKCDMCQGRLAAGEAPACVQACPNGAIAVRLVATSATREAATGALVPGAPPSSLTVPSTVYRTSRPALRATGAPDIAPPSAGQAHPPLAAMLVLTQLSVGAFVIDLLVRRLAEQPGGALPLFDAVVAVGTGVLALAASVFHLGRPRYCYRAVIGLRHSWLSREVVAFGAFTGLAALYALVLWVEGSGHGGAVTTLLGATVAAFGLAGVVSSVMVYATTSRRSWRLSVVAPKFVLSAAVGGLASVLCASTAWALASGSAPEPTLTTVGRPLAGALAVLLALKLTGEAAVFRHLLRRRAREGTRTALLLLRELRVTTARRFAAGVTALACALVVAGSASRPSGGVAALAALCLLAVLVGELAERRLFFTAATPPR